MEAFSLGTLQPIAEKLGVKLPKEGTFQDAIKVIHSATDDLYADAFKTIKTVDWTKRGVDLQRQAIAYANKNVKDDALKDRFANKLSNVVSEFLDPKGFTAKRFKEVDSDLGKDIRALYNKLDMTSEERHLAESYKLIQNSIRSMAEAKDPTGKLKLANDAFSKLQLPQEASTGLNALKNSGAFTPQELLGKVKKEYSEPLVARGEAPYQQMSQAGTEVLGNRAPPMLQKLAERGVALGGIGAVGLHDPVTAGVLTGLGALSSPVLYSPLGQKVLAKTMTNRPEIMNKALQPLATATGNLGGLTGMSAGLPVGQTVADYNKSLFGIQ
jgi:hypothetical protein